MYRGFMLAVGLLSVMSTAARANEQYRFVSEYVREITEYEALRNKAAEAGKGQNANDLISDCVANSEEFQLAIGASVHVLKEIRLSGQFNEVKQALIGFYAQRALIWKRLGEGCAQLMAPRPGVDYSPLVAEVPKLRGQLDYIDKALFEATPAIFAALVDQREDSQGHASHLVISRAERDQLVSRLNNSFGARMDNPKATYVVSSGWLLKEYLSKKGYLCSDEPWQ